MKGKGLLRRSAGEGVVRTYLKELAREPERLNFSASSGEPPSDPRLLNS